MKASELPSFNSKILLFGEYSLMYGSMALSSPFEQFSGQLVQEGDLLQNENALVSNQELRKYVYYLEKLENESLLAFKIDIARLSKDIEQGLYFKSNIPQGYGLGSSGAMVAAIFNLYGKYNEGLSNDNNQLEKLKLFFGLIESYFHGKSSGLDPLISFLNKTVRITENNELETINLGWSSGNNKGAVFLIDSGKSGETEPLVSYFRERYKEQVYKNTVDYKLIPLVNNAVKAYISKDEVSLFSLLPNLSRLQLDLFDFMIPGTVKEMWKTGLETSAYFLKLCGSGGGGMMLGFTPDIKSVAKQLEPFNPIIIHRL